MSESPSSESRPNQEGTNNAPTRENDNSSPNEGRGRGRRHRRKNNDASRAVKFKGKCPDIQGVYDVGLPHSNQDLFITTTKEIAEYVAGKFENAGEFRLGLVNLQLPPLVLPAPPPAGAGLNIPDAIVSAQPLGAQECVEADGEKGEEYSLAAGQRSYAEVARMESKMNVSK